MKRGRSVEDRMRKELKAIVLEIRGLLEGRHDSQGRWKQGDLEERLAFMGVWRDREPLPRGEMDHLGARDSEARRLIDGHLALGESTDSPPGEAVGGFLRAASYGWANRLMSLRCMEARGLIDEVITRRPVYGGRSLEHHRLLQREPAMAGGDDDGLFSVLDTVFSRMARDLPLLFNPGDPAMALRPSIGALNRCIDLLSGAPVTHDVFRMPSALGWAYQYWNSEEKSRVFERVRLEKGSKIEGDHIIPATQVYTEPYIVKYLVQNSLGALWMRMHPESRLFKGWDYYLKGDDVPGTGRKSLRDITLLDPACGSGHFLLEAFDLFYCMYLEEGEITAPREVCRSILSNNLFGVDIDERAIHISEAVLWMKAAEKSPGFPGVLLNLAAASIRRPRESPTDAFQGRHCGDRLKTVLEALFRQLDNAGELGSLLVPAGHGAEDIKGIRDALARADDNPSMSWIDGGLRLINILSRTYDVVTSNPPYMSFRTLGKGVAGYLKSRYPDTSSDLYGAMLSRGRSLVRAGGVYAFVTPQGWFALHRFKGFRAMVLEEDSVHSLVTMGQDVFAEAPLLFVGLFTAFRAPPSPSHSIATINMAGARSPAEELPGEISSPTGRSIRVLQKAVEGIPGKPLVAGVPESLVEAMASPVRLGHVCRAHTGMQTGDNLRSVRFHWEIPARDGRWVPYQKGKGYCRWAGHSMELVDAEGDYARVSETPSALLKKVASSSSDGIEYSYVYGGKMSARRIPPSIRDNGSVGVFPKEDRWFPLILAYLNSRFATLAARMLSPTLNFTSGCLVNLPLPGCDRDDLARRLSKLVDGCVRLKSRALLYRRGLAGNSGEFAVDFLAHVRASAILHTLEFKIEKMLSEAWGFGPEEEEFIWSRCGRPVGSFPRLEHGPEGSPSFNAGPAGALMGRLRSLLQTSTFPERERQESSGARGTLSLPAETLVERLSLKLQAHPLSVYRLLKRGIKVEGWGCPSEERAYMVNLVGHILLESFRNPSGEGRLGIKGVLPLGGSLGLLGGGRPLYGGSLEDRFHEVMGLPLTEWLEREFFKEHLKVFRKRPIIWQVRSQPGPGRRAAFSCFVHYPDLGPGILRDISSIYLRPALIRLEAELHGHQGPPGDDHRRVQHLKEILKEVKDFDDRLQGVCREGFECEELRLSSATEVLDEWCSADGVTPAPESAGDFYHQEARYSPDLNDGVRVNIAPLQRAGLLASPVLNERDVERAIAARSRWRRDDRRLCREGKLASPGWWKER